MAAVLQDALQRLVDFAAPAQRFAEVRRADRGDHEFLEVGALPVGMHAAVQDVEHRHGQQVGLAALLRYW